MTFLNSFLNAKERSCVNFMVDTTILDFNWISLLHVSVIMIMKMVVLRMMKDSFQGL